MLGKLDGVGTIISRSFKLIWVLLKSFWPISVMLASVLWAVVPALQGAAEAMATRADAMWASLNGIAGDMWAASLVGFPPAWANGIAYVNNYLPISEMVFFVGVLLATYATAALIRVFKSFLPTVA